ncbi:homeobox and leucine zipper encoding b [Nematolebias whitei]|uniref:homeobox and leucine zipper encoding b n=1 Tax=Nematolebias whitei TaxID=451745 RepID=UPI0018991A66|nr:homeobox and leucine zipper encoding b [Nematolebias whitei]
MRQLAEGGHISPRQKTPDAGTQSSSNVEMPCGKEGTNTPVCLPLLSESKRLLWVHSNQIVLPADLVAELDKAFDRFPYLTRKQNALLAQRCSLHPDQVKVWFMAQRLQYGISWDVKDICDVRNKFRSSAKDAEENGEVQNKMDEEVQEDKRKEKNQKEKGGESGEEKGRGEKRPKEGRMIARNVRANEQLERKTKQEQPMKKEKPRETEKDKPSTPKKRKRGAEPVKDKKMWVTQDDGEGAATVEVKTDESEKEGQASIESEEAALNKRKEKVKKEQMFNQTETVNANPTCFHKPSTQTLTTILLTENQTDPQHAADTPSTFSVMTPVNDSCDGKPEALAGPQEDLHTEAANLYIVVTDVGKQKELTTVDSSLIAADDPPTLIKPDADRHAAPTGTRSKTRAQLAMMKMAFLHCQYPNSEQYSWLTGVTKIPRHVLVQWYGDMRYSLKRAKPRWMTKEQYDQALSNIRHHQYLSMLRKSTDRANNAYAAWMTMIKEGKGCNGKESEEASALKTESTVDT